MGKKDKTTTTTQRGTTTVAADAETRGRADQLWNLGINALGPAESYRSPLTAGLSPDQQAAFSLIRGAGDVGAAQLNTGTQYATAAGAYDPSQVTALRGPDSNIQAADLMGPAAGARDVSASAFTDFDIAKYLSPYTQNVVDTSLSDIERARREAQNQIAGRQAASGAFGDSRSGVEASLTNREYANIAASTAAQLHQAGFSQAADLITRDADRRLSADQGNQGADVATSIANLNAGTQAGISAAGLRDRYADRDLQAQVANQGAGLTANAQKLNAAGVLDNLGMSSQGRVLNQANALGAAGQVAQQTQQAGLTANYQEWLRKQGWDNQQIQQLAGIFNSLPKGSTTTVNGTTKSVEPGSMFGDILGAGLSLVGGLPAIGTKLGINLAS